MTTVEVADDGGFIFLSKSLNGRLFPNFPEPNGLQDLASVKIRPDDVILCSFPKSGTNWLFECIWELMTGKPIDEHVHVGGTFMDKTPEAKYADCPSPRILCTHVRPDMLPADVFSLKNKIIMIIRNPKDVAVSNFNFIKKRPFYHYDEGKWEHFIRPYIQGKFPYGSWFDYHRHWGEVRAANPDQPFFVTSYEDMKQNQMKELRRLSEFLEASRDDSFLENVIRQTSFNSMKDAHGGSFQELYRKGQVGDWKNWFTMAQNEWFDAYYTDRMTDIPFDIQFTLPETDSL